MDKNRAVNKNSFSQFKGLVAAENNPIMDKLVDEVEEYNNGLSAYFKERGIPKGVGKITRTITYIDKDDGSELVDETEIYEPSSFMLMFDMPLTAARLQEVFENIPLVDVIISDLCKVARNTWYYENEDSSVILTGDDLAEANAVYWVEDLEPEPLKQLVGLLKFYSAVLGLKS